MNQSLFDMSLEGSGPLSRPFNEASTSGFIREDAPHWSIEPFVPIQVQKLVEYLIARQELSPRQLSTFRQVCEDADRIVHEQTHSYHTRFLPAYLPLDPDSDTKDPQQSIAADAPTTEQSLTDPTEAIEICAEILQQAGYRKLSQESIEQCVGVASQWGVPLHVDFTVFARLEVYARGDIIGQRLRRRLRKLYRKEHVDVPIYQRMVVMFQLRRDDETQETLAASALHLRLFKNIPKQDVDMLLPGTRIRLSGADRVKIVVPSLSGFLLSLRKIELIIKTVLLFAAIALNWTAILLALVIGYVIKCIFSYSQTRNRYQLHLNRNLYFQKLDTNAGVAYQIIQQAQRQMVVETVLAYYAIVTSDQPISTRRLRRKCERIVREAIDVEVDFQAEGALERLLQMHAIRKAGEHWASRLE
jgi:Protein of unknown function (DUF3754)